MLVDATRLRNMPGETSTISIVIGAFVSIIGGFGVIAKIMLVQAAKDRDADRDERIKLTQAVEQMANSSAKVADVTKDGFKKLTDETAKQSLQAEQRNGHLGEMVAKSQEMLLQNQENTKALAEAATTQIITAFTAIQNVGEQHVKHQTVEKTDKEEE